MAYLLRADDDDVVIQRQEPVIDVRVRPDIRYENDAGPADGRKTVPRPYLLHLRAFLAREFV